MTATMGDGRADWEVHVAAAERTRARRGTRAEETVDSHDGQALRGGH